MYLGIALHLAINEKEDRMLWVQKFYDILSKLEVTMATPTLSNARKPFHQYQVVSSTPFPIASKEYTEVSTTLLK